MTEYDKYVIWCLVKGEKQLMNKAEFNAIMAN